MMSAISCVHACCVLQNDCTVKVDSLKLRDEIALWHQKWIGLRLKNESNFVPETAVTVAAMEACDQTTFPLIHTFMSILVTLPVSIASAERSLSTLRRVKTWLRSRVTEDRLTNLTLMIIHRDIQVDVDKVIDHFANSKHRFMEFVI